MDDLQVSPGRGIGDISVNAETFNKVTTIVTFGVGYENTSSEVHPIDDRRPVV